jgi:hypothetical protein
MAGWTLDQLVAQVAAALDGHAGPAADRRVRQVPDRRAIRWYTTIGLLDRPEMRGRTGWYGERHLLQLVGIKRLQAAGRSLAEIQVQLAGVTDDTLRQIADLPDQQTRPPVVSVRGAERAGRFWAEPVDTRPVVDTRWLVGSDPVVDARTTGAARGGSAVLRLAVELADGVTLLVTQTDGRAVPDPAALSVVRDAARPLLDVLVRHGLMPSAVAVPATSTTHVASTAPDAPIAPGNHDTERETP